MLRFFELSDAFTKFGFCGTFITNIFFLYLTVFHIRQIAGTYKQMVVTFGLFGILFSAMELVSRPFVHNYNKAFMFFSLNSWASRQFVQCAIVVYAGFYGVILSLIAVQFVFRYLSLTSSKWRHMFDGIGCIGWIAYPCLVGTAFGVPLILAHPDEFTDDYMREEILKIYGFSMGDVARFIVIPYNADGSVRWHNLFFLINGILILGLQYVIIIYCVLKMRNEMNKELRKFSVPHLRLQRQVFRALIVQALVPTVLFVLPAVPVLLGPLLDIEMSLQTGVIYALLNMYPSFDSIAFMVIVRLNGIVASQPEDNGQTCVPIEAQPPPIRTTGAMIPPVSKVAIVGDIVSIDLEKVRNSIPHLNPNGLVRAVQNKSAFQFYQENREVLEEVAQRLSQVTLPHNKSKIELPYDIICFFICQNFLRLFYNPESIIVPEGSYEQRFQSALIYASRNNDWPKFYIDHEQILDTIILWARNQKVMYMCIEADNLEYKSFKDIRLDRKDDDMKLFLCFPCAQKRGKTITRSKSNQKSITTQPTAIATVSPCPLSHRSAPCQSGPSQIVQEEQVQERPNHLPVSGGSFNGNRQDRSASTLKSSEPNKCEAPQVHRMVSNASTLSSDWDARRQKLDESFRRKLEMQENEYTEKIRKIREERERSERDAEEQWNKFKRDSDERVRFFFMCTTQKLIWEEQEQQWEEWLKSVRDPILKVKTKFGRFGYRSYRNLCLTNTEAEMNLEMFQIDRLAQIAYDCLLDHFEKATELSKEYEDKLFLKVIQKKVSLMATKLCHLLDALRRFKSDENSYGNIKSCEKLIYPWDIPTANQLRRICKTANPDEYNHVEQPEKLRPHSSLSNPSNSEKESSKPTAPNPLVRDFEKQLQKACAPLNTQDTQRSVPSFGTNSKVNKADQKAFESKLKNIRTSEDKKK
ncbi:unnamed protein product [Caenorhabditis sp. 36 PRJEB53466]|nr:unnamed protein product [Caenorhabditis sp. 36 PRJEB53466]